MTCRRMASSTDSLPSTNFVKTIAIDSLWLGIAIFLLYYYFRIYAFGNWILFVFSGLSGLGTFEITLFGSLPEARPDQAISLSSK